MDPARWQKVEEIFHAADQKPAGEREQYVETACGGDEDLQKEVFALLAAQDDVGDFMAEPPLDKKFELDTATSLFEMEDRSFVGKEVGPYRLEKIIASGGMGTVYLAARTDKSFQRKAAVKLIRGGLQNREIIRRFYRERQILANLDHPNIASLLDGGTTDDGHPFLVMEYIEGEAIDRYCDSRKLSVSARLEIFLQVCAAVQFAHRKLVVHRDIKPGNILVTGDGIPKLLDFGIVKILDPEAVTDAALTLTVQRLMTPEYASPEQIRGGTISTATDVYSLGIVLYEILTGHRPYRFESTSPVDVERIVCEEDPPRPSAVISETVDVSSTRGKQRSLTPESVSRSREGRPDKLRRRLAGDLDHIVMKALRKEPEKRYASVEHLAEDIRRHLARRPVHARRGTWRYRASKFVKRNKTAAVAAFFVFMAIAAACYFALAEARRAADQQAAQQVLDFLSHIYENPFSEQTPRMQVRETLETKKTLELARDLQDQPEELIGYAETIITICEGFHLDDLVVQWRGISLETYESLLPPDDPELAKARYRFAQALHRAGRLRDAEEQVRALMSRSESKIGESENFTGLLHHLLAMILWDQGNYRKPAALFEESMQQLSGRESAPSLDLVRTMLDYAAFLDDLGDVADAEGVLQRALDASEMIPEEPGRLIRAAALHGMGVHLWRTPRFNESEIHLRGALDIYQHHLPEWDPRIAACMNDLFSVLRFSVQKGESFTDNIATAFWEKGWKIRQKVFGKQSLETAESLFAIAPELTFGSASIGLSRNAIEQFGHFWPDNHPRLTGPSVWLGACLSNIKQPREFIGNLPEGEEMLRQSLAIQSRHYSPGHWRIGQARFFLGCNLLKQGRSRDGAALISDGLIILEKCYGPDHPLLSRNLGWAAIYSQLGGLQEEERLYTARHGEKTGRWPYGDTIRDSDFSREQWARVDFEDDQLEKVLIIDRPLEKDTKTILWIYGQPGNWVWRDFQDVENMRLRVNHDPSREISFSVIRKFCFMTDIYQWVPFVIPADWLRIGPNVFTFFEEHDERYVENRSWEFNNLRVGVDLDNDHDRSWWFGSSEKPCCEAMGRAAMKAEKPISRDAPFIQEHREIGYKECEGELMIFLELD